MSNLELLDRAAAATTCQMLGASGSALVGVGAVGIVSGGVGFVPLSAGALALLAANYLCPDMPMGGEDMSYRKGCQFTPEGGFPVGFTPDGDDDGGGIGFSYYQWTELVEVDVTDDPSNEERINARITARNLDGTVSGTDPAIQNYPKGTTFGMRPAPGTNCGGRDDGTLPVPPDAESTYTYVDQSTNCTYNVTLQGFAEPYPGGPTQPVFLIEAASESGGEHSC